MKHGDTEDMTKYTHKKIVGILAAKAVTATEEVLPEGVRWKTSCGMAHCLAGIRTTASLGHNGL